MIVQPYVFFPGNCQQAIDFYCETLQAKVQFKMTFAEAPDRDASPECVAAPPDGIMHANLLLGSSQVMMSDDPRPGQAPHCGYALSIGSDDVTQAKVWFDALSEGGEVRVPFAETFWADGFGILKDRFGVFWMINVERRIQS